MRIIPIAIALLVVASPAEAQRRCTKGIPCGNGCISASKTCRIGTSQPTPASQPATRSAPADSSAVQQGEIATEGRWVASSRGRMYYRADCSSAKRLASTNRIYFKSEEEAQRAGYTRSRAKGC